MNVICRDLTRDYPSEAGKIRALEDVDLRVAPGLFTLDLAVRKNVWHTDRQTVLLRAESYNLTNHPNFAVPSGDNLSLFDSRGQRLQTADRITDTATTSRQIPLSLRWFF